MLKKKYRILLLLIFLVILVFFIPFEKEIHLKPLSAKDSDGKPSSEIIKLQESFEYFAILKVHPYGYVQIDAWENETNVKKASILVDWKTDEFGAGNIYIGYFDGNSWFELGPFKQNKNITRTVLDIPKSRFSDISSVVFRFRGEDLDFGVDAVSWIKAEVLVKKEVYGLISFVI